MFEAEVNELRTAIELLSHVEGDYLETLQDTQRSRDAAMLEEAFHRATHEAATVIGLSLQDIQTLIQRIQIRDKHREFTQEQFDMIVASQWSTGLVARMLPLLASEHAFSLPSLSRRIKEIQTEWNALRRLSGNYEAMFP